MGARRGQVLALLVLLCVLDFADVEGSSLQTAPLLSTAAIPLDGTMFSFGIESPPDFGRFK